MPPPERSVFWRIVILTGAIRIALEAIGLVSLAAHGEPVFANALNMWNRWDAPHYLRIAEVGYRPEGAPGDDPLFIVFFPFFPLAVRLVSVIARDLVLSGLVVSFVASVGATWLLYKLVALDADHAEAWRAVLLLLSFPTAYYLAAPYTEALFLFAVIASVYAARTGHWARSGIAAALATGTRVAGIALLPALLVEAVSDRAPFGRIVRRVPWIAVGISGLAIYIAINWVVHADPLHFLDVQRSHWFQRPVAPWTPITDALSGVAAPRTTTQLLIYAGRIYGAGLAVVLLILAVRRLRVADTIYGWAGLLLVLSASWLISLPRYLLALYPLFMVSAQLTRNRVVLWSVVVIGALAQIGFFWRYAVGEWTF